MTAAIILAELDQLDRDRAALMERLRAALADDLGSVPNAPTVATQADDFKMPDDLIPAAAGAALARRAKSTLANWCRSNAFDGRKGFAYRIGARWFVTRSGLLKHLSSDSRD